MRDKFRIKFSTICRKPLLSLLLLLAFLEFLPVSGKETAKLRLYEGHDYRYEYTTYYVLQPDGDLISWGRGPLDRSEDGNTQGTSPYFLRRTLARNVIDFTSTPFAFFYVDENHVLWGSGTDKEILHSEEPGRVRLMEDIAQITADSRYALALKTDGSVWAWAGRDVVNINRESGMEPSDSTPLKIAENMQSIFAMDYTYYAITEENTLVRLSLSGGKPAVIARDVKAVSLAYLPGKTLHDYLTQKGEVYTINTRHSIKAADGVASLCEGGFIKEDHSLWTWDGTYPDVISVKMRDNVQTAASCQFYADTYGRLHWITSALGWKTLSRSVRWLDPAFRNTGVVLLLLCVLYKCCKRKRVNDEKV